MFMKSILLAAAVGIAGVSLAGCVESWEDNGGYYRSGPYYNPGPYYGNAYFGGGVVHKGDRHYRPRHDRHPRPGHHRPNRPHWEKSNQNRPN